ncbi:MAG: hypothetical protein ACM3OO_06650 [Planctomycetaceae bacterium]
MRPKLPYRAVALAVSLVVLAGSAGLAAPARATTAPRASRVLNPGPLVHLLPTRTVASSLRASRAATAGTPSLHYYGGPVMQRGITTIPVFWEPPTLQDGTAISVSASYHTLLARFLDDLGGHGFMSALTQYYETVHGTNQHIVNASAAGAPIVITAPYPAAAGGCLTNGRTNCITDAQLQHQLASTISANGLPVNGSTLYLVFTAPLEESCYDAADCFNPVTKKSWVYCAYHSAFFPSASSRPVIYANMPYLDSNSASANGCSSGASHPNDPAFDDESPTLGHEIAEAITDPLPGSSLAPPTAWVDPHTGNEIADICDTATSATAVTWSGNTYEVSPNWSNATASCVTGGAQAVSTSPTSGLPGSSTTLTGSGFDGTEQVTLRFVDAAGTVFPLRTTTASAGAISPTLQLPGNTDAGAGTVEAIGTSPDDGASAAFTVQQPPFRPDALIGRAKTGPFTGNGVYATGTKERLSAKVRHGSTITLWMPVQHDGTTADTVTLQGTKAPAGFTVAYRIGTKDVTSAVVAGTLRRSLAPAATFSLKVVITVKSSTAPGKVFAAKVLAASQGDATKKDAVVGSVTST